MYHVGHWEVSNVRLDWCPFFDEPKVDCIVSRDLAKLIGLPVTIGSSFYSEDPFNLLISAGNEQHQIEITSLTVDELADKKKIWLPIQRNESLELYIDNKITFSSSGAICFNGSDPVDIEYVRLKTRLFDRLTGHRSDPLNALDLILPENSEAFRRAKFTTRLRLFWDVMDLRSGTGVSNTVCSILAYLLFAVDTDMDVEMDPRLIKLLLDQSKFDIVACMAEFNYLFEMMDKQLVIADTFRSRTLLFSVESKMDRQDYLVAILAGIEQLHRSSELDKVEALEDILEIYGLLVQHNGFYEEDADAIDEILQSFRHLPASSSTKNEGSWNCPFVTVLRWLLKYWPFVISRRFLLLHADNKVDKKSLHYWLMKLSPLQMILTDRVLDPQTAIEEFERLFTGLRVVPSGRIAEAIDFYLANTWFLGRANNSSISTSLYLFFLNACRLADVSTDPDDLVVMLSYYNHKRLFQLFLTVTSVPISRSTFSKLAKYNLDCFAMALSHFKVSFEQVRHIEQKATPQVKKKIALITELYVLFTSSEGYSLPERFREADSREDIDGLSTAYSYFLYHHFRITMDKTEIWFDYPGDESIGMADHQEFLNGLMERFCMLSGIPLKDPINLNK